MLPLVREFRALLYLILGMVVPFAVLLCFFPNNMQSHWAWAIPHPRSAILIGTTFLGVTFYCALTLKENDWLQAQNGAGGLIIFSSVLLIATMAHWNQFRVYHISTLAWLTLCYVGPFMVPIAYRKQNSGMPSKSTFDQNIGKFWRGWLSFRGFLYLTLAMFWLAQAETIAQIWPWPMNPLELRVFSSQPALIGWNAVVVLGGRFLWRSVRLGLLLSGAIGLAQIIGLMVNPTSYTVSGMGIVLPLIFAEWIVTPLLMFINYEWGRPSEAESTNSLPLPVVSADSYIQFGTKLIGAGYAAIGVIGFLPIYLLNPIHHEGVGARYLFNLIATNSTHNVIHLSIGVTALFAARQFSSARLWGRICGPMLLLLFIGGLVQAFVENLPVDQLFLGVVPLNSPGHILHLATGLIAFYVGNVSSGPRQSGR